MPRNNQDRLGSQAPSADPPIPAPSTPSQLEFVVPTEFVELPSKGLLYPEGHPLCEVSEVEIKFMTAKEEDILTDKVLLKKGLALDRLMSNIILDKTINPDMLLTGDRTAIMIAARKSAYGPEYDTKTVCPVCFSHGRHTFDLDNAEVRFNQGKDVASIDDNMTIRVTTPRSKVKVALKFMTGHDEKKILEKQNNNKRLKLPENSLINQLRTIIVSVNDNTDRRYINSFIDAMPAFDSRYIRDIYQKNNPTIQLKEEYVCGECNATSMVDVPFTTDFFWPQ